jgi:hypothetical protein
MELIGHANVGDWRGFATFRGLTEILSTQATHGTPMDREPFPSAYFFSLRFPATIKVDARRASSSIG